MMRFKGSWPLAKSRRTFLYPIAFDQAGAKAADADLPRRARDASQGNSFRRTQEIMQARYNKDSINAGTRGHLLPCCLPVLRPTTMPEESDGRDDR